MIFENITQSIEPNKQIEKHIKLNPNVLFNLNCIQLAYKTETKNNLTFNELVNISLDLFIKDLKNEIKKTNENQAIKYIETLLKEFETENKGGF